VVSDVVSDDLSLYGIHAVTINLWLIVRRVSVKTVRLRFFRSAANVGIVAFGEGKAEIVQRALEVQCLPGALPAQLVRPSEGTLRWLLDCAAASRLSITKWNNTKDFPRSQ
jgi:6-phosphogluconolactonase